MFSEQVQEVEMNGIRAEARQTTRRTVLEAAGKLFDERGFLETTVRDIARKAGVSVGTVMAAGDKETLLVEFFDSLIAERQQYADALAPGVGTRCDEEAVAVVEPFVSLFDERRDLAQAYASILVGGRHSSVVFTDLARRLIAVFEHLVEACGCPRSVDARGCADAFHAAYIGSLFMWSATPERSVSEFTAQLRDVFAAICPHGGGHP
ncbi:TetR/AcrR family transcriptional regulator [Corynebacterium sp. CCM 8835]|uniref:TetR/AcrR family transcriptional regulator n=2 Tax=Corynebacterium antarcticum TaxID=2800405 RepID=A0A9Q4CCZ9_9CORY|nr:TetR/AcrR family transcriptional regulator [Corynebacterium antarcticum]MCL0246041.1 TetR/AcrR family transcriptional regulator [Corynebacterium antarcticum]MCX7538593.1 TetR/AcrR family transcriptional regulator [Corynebacterium antarcticum]